MGSMFAIHADPDSSKVHSGKIKRRYKVSKWKKALMFWDT